MMGAQARAVEYNAARNASARQASREAEEQRLPPEKTLIPLCSFSRAGSAQGRNKGPKKFTPLILESTGEEDELASSDDQAKSSPAAVMSPPTSGRFAGNEHCSHNSDRIRVNLPCTGAGSNTVPSAPRAMRPTADPFANDTPTRVEMAMGGSSGPRIIPPTSQYGMSGQVPGFVFRSGLSTVGHRQGGTPEAMTMHGNGLEPLDITPTKQEHKLSTMYQAYGHNAFANRLEPAMAAAPAQAPAPATASGHAPFPLHAAQIAYPYVEFPGVALPAAWDIGQAAMMHNLILPVAPASHGCSDATPVSQTGSILPSGRVVGRHHKWAEGYEARVTPSRVKLQPPVGDGSVGPKSRDSHGDAYDRSSKMQLFVAAQQAFAKTGKTVLNSREADESQAGKPNTVPAEPGAEQGIELGAEQVGQRTIPRAPPGLGLVPKGEPEFGLDSQEGTEDKDEKKITEGEADEEGENQVPPLSATDVMLHELFGVGTPEWFQLRAPTELDRQKMRFALRYVGSRMQDECQQGDPRQPW